jgi:hypothetical protein
LSRWEKPDVTLFPTSSLAALLLALQAQPQAPQAPSRPFGTEPAWPAGDILTTQARPVSGALGEPAPRQPQRSQDRPTVSQQRVRAPYRQAEEPALQSLDEVRREQLQRVQRPEAWRRNMLGSERQTQLQSRSAFRETPVGPELRQPPEVVPPGSLTMPDPRFAPVPRSRLRPTAPY